MEFGSSQVERVLDLMDVNFLRRALKDSKRTSQSRDSSQELAKCTSIVVTRGHRFRVRMDSEQAFFSQNIHSIGVI